MRMLQANKFYTHRSRWVLLFSAEESTIKLCKFQFVALLESVQPATKLPCHCEEAFMADVAISCLAARYCKMLINIEYLRCSMSIGLYKFELQCWRFPRQGFALPRNDILDGAAQQPDKHQFEFRRKISRVRLHPGRLF